MWGPFFTDDEDDHDEDGGGSYGDSPSKPTVL